MRRLQGQVVYDDSSETIDETEAVPGALAVHYLPADKLLLDSWRYRYVKRALDIVLGSVMLLVFLVPGLLIALGLYLSTPYPVFYTEERIGRGGVPFRIWKFRSMRPHGIVSHASGPHAERTVLQYRMFKHKNDPRITALGRFLRRWSLDEVPQVINVLRGDMSLIGPRPIVKAETHLYKYLLPYYLAATPGLSGLWQVSGRSDLNYDVRARLDATYVETWSLTSDLAILLRTIPAVLNRVGAR
jgi:lipopolysaccharide/colanic/teichoic acid biosynthesis glycosyltransferase